MGQLLYRGPTLDELHEQYAKRGRIDHRAAVSASATVHIDASPQMVWRVLSDLSRWTAVDRTISAVRVPDGVREDSPFVWTSGWTRIRSRFAIVDPERELTWTGVASGARAVHRHVLSATESGGTRLFSEESLAGPFLTLLFDSRRLGDDLARWLDAIKAAAESGGVADTSPDVSAAASRLSQRAER